MRSLEINKKKIWYALYRGKTPVLDDEGWETGDYINSYSEPKEFRLRVAPNKGESNSEMFGVLLDYDRVMSTTDKKFPVDEYSILWVDKEPILGPDGNYPVGSEGIPIIGHDYKIVRVAKDINVWTYAIKAVS